MGTIRSSSGARTVMAMPGKRLRKARAAEARTSSATSSPLTSSVSPPMRVMERRFSTTRMSHCPSSRTFSSISFCCSFGRSGLSRMAEAEPMMEVRGVRISWEMERRRLERIRSFSASARRDSHFFILVVRAEVKMDTVRRVRKVKG